MNDEEELHFLSLCFYLLWEKKKKFCQYSFINKEYHNTRLHYSQIRVCFLFYISYILYICTHMWIYTQICTHLHVYAYILNLHRHISQASG